MARNVLVVVEQWQGQVSEITYELLALGREVADQLLAPLQAVLLGHNVKPIAGTLGTADSVLYLDHPLLAEPLPEVYVEALAGLAGVREARCILCPLTTVSLGMGALLADRLGAPSVSLCKDLRVVADNYEATCLLYGGKIEAVVSVEASPAVFSVRPGARPAHRGRIERRPPFEEVIVSLPEAPPVRLKGYTRLRAGDVDITQEDVLVAVGRGIQSRANLALAGRLAESLGGLRFAAHGRLRVAAAVAAGGMCRVDCKARALCRPRNQRRARACRGNERRGFGSCYQYRSARTHISFCALWHRG